MFHRTTLLLLSSMLAFGCQPQTPPPQAAQATGPLEGAWSLTGLEEVAADGTRTVLTPQESLFLFAGGHYSMAYAVGEQRSPFYADRFNPTDAESLARMNSMTVNAGTFEIQGTRVIVRPMVARVPEFVGGRAEHEFTVSGDTLTLRWERTVSADGVEPADGGATILTLVRLR